MNMVPAENEKNIHIYHSTQGSAGSRKVPQKKTVLLRYPSIHLPSLKAIEDTQDERRWIRVKTCGKSVRLCTVMCVMGKPYQKQDKQHVSVVHSGLSMRVRRIDKWLSICIMLHCICKSQNPAYCNTT